MSESSDTTHEAILHNLVSHQRVLQRQIGEVSQDIQELKQQLSALVALVNQVAASISPFRSDAEANRGSSSSHEIGDRPHGRT